MINSYFDYSDFNHRDLKTVQNGTYIDSYGLIRSYIDDRFFMEVEGQRAKKANILLQKSQVNLQDDFIQLGQSKVVPFIEIVNSHFYDDQYNRADGYISTIYIRYDAQYSEYNRQIYSIMEFLGDVGGMQSSLFFIGYLLVAFFSHRLFISAILRNLYQVKDLKKTYDENGDPMHGYF